MILYVRNEIKYEGQEVVCAILDFIASCFLVGLSGGIECLHSARRAKTDAYFFIYIYIYIHMCICTSMSLKVSPIPPATRLLDCGFFVVVFLCL